MDIIAVEGWIALAVFFVLLVVKLFAFGSALTFSADSYEAAGKLSKTAWCSILGVAVVLQLVPINLMLFNIAATIAALVYLADVRPALAGLYRR